MTYDPACSRRVPWALVTMLLISGCFSPRTPIGLTSFDPGEEQIAIARYYQQEAERYRQRGEEALSQAVVYERLFGAESDWVKGARLLAESYFVTAEQHDELAEQHLKRVERGRRSSRDSSS